MPNELSAYTRALLEDIEKRIDPETEEDFKQSLSIIEEAKFSQIHAFPYSPREGTNAYKKYKELPFALKKERVARILEVGMKQKQKYLQGFIGREVFIVPERFFGGYTEGYSENYIRVYVRGEIGKEPTRVRVESVFKDGVLTSVVQV